MKAIPLTDDALAACPWAGSSTHRGYIAQALRCADKGEVDFLALADDNGELVSMGGVDYTRDPHTPTLWMVATDPARRSLGYGSALIAALEQAAAWRGHAQMRLLVEDNNPRAYTLYQRLGYHDTGTIEHESWESENENGTITTYHATCAVMVKQIAAQQG